MSDSIDSTTFDWDGFVALTVIVVTIFLIILMCVVDFLLLLDGGK